MLLSRPGSEIKLSRVGNQIPIEPYVVDTFRYGEVLIYRTQYAVIVSKQAFAAIVTENCGLSPQLFRIVLLPYLVDCLLSSLAAKKQ
jgi:hypothetical protein